MKKINKKNVVVVIIIIVLLITAVIVSVSLVKNKNISENNTGFDLLSNYDENDPTYDESVAISIELNGDSINVDSSNVNVNGNMATIKSSGIYILTGHLAGSINIETEEIVRLIFKNVTIESTDGPAIYVKNADKVIITLDENTNNSLKDSLTYSDLEASATIYAKDDLTFNGYGSLNIEGIYQDGIVSKDDLKIISGTYTVTAMNNGIKGKDSIKIKDGNIAIEAQNDCIKSTNSVETEKGYIEIENGTLNLTSEHDGIQAENYILIENGNINILSGGGSENSTKIGTTTDIFVRGKFINPRNSNFQNEDTTEDTGSYKGIKAQKSISIKSGEININSADDSIHSNGTIEITNPNIKIESGDDGIHADDTVTIHGGKIDITKSYEGIEANNITINNGEFNIVSSDDGINVAGGNDSSSTMGRPGQNNFSNNSNIKLEINGGKIYINASGDGLDSNGAIYINDGIIYVDGPSDGGNGALDYENELVMNGGEMIAVGSSQMAQCISNTSTVNCLNLNISSTQNAKSKFSIIDSNNNEIISYTPSKSYQSVVFASSKLETGKTYTININDNQYSTFTVSSIISNIGNSADVEKMMRPRM
ncbi:MAG: carbohydrate-binding domain-containing protein [Clostridia bacterium]|nr:carbohydrate-binding domain-containing protein [Clostridia bacterium]